MVGLPALSSNLVFLGLIFALIVIPRALQRFRLPAPLSSFGLGMLAVRLQGGAIHDPTLALLSTLGISSLFLFAGLDVEVHELWRGRRPLVSHLLLQSLLVAGAVWFAMGSLGQPWTVGLLTALALLTPSTGFILEALPALGLDADERFWVSIKAVGGEILALGIVFVVLQSGSTTLLTVSTLAIVFMVLGIPWVLHLLVRLVVPYAPGAEFSLLVMVGLVAAYLTERLGVNYLFGAFLAGFIARQLRSRLPKLASDENLRAVQLFASFFIPFYFFAAGMDVPTAALTWQSLEFGLLFTGTLLPIRIALVWLQRRFIKGETAIGSLKVATALSPTLIFTLVLATILHDRFHLADSLYGGLLVYAGTSTLLPSLALTQRAESTAGPTPSVDAVEAPLEVERNPP